MFEWLRSLFRASRREEQFYYYLPEIRPGNINPVVPSRRSVAEAYHHALLENYVDPEEVVQWVDDWIMELDSPPDALIDASLSARDRNNLISALRAIPGRPDSTEVNHQFLVLMYRTLVRDRERAGDIIRTLLRMVIDEEILEPETQNAIYYLDHVYAAGYGWSLNSGHDVVEDLLTFLKHQAEPV